MVFIIDKLVSSNKKKDEKGYKNYDRTPKNNKLRN